MPVRRLQDRDTSRQDLVAELVRGWDDDALDEPVVVIDDQGGRYSPVHLWVVWTRWDDVPRQERSRVILDAYREKAASPDDVLRVSVAMGLTPDEANRMELPWR